MAGLDPRDPAQTLLREGNVETCRVSTLENELRGGREGHGGSGTGGGASGKGACVFIGCCNLRFTVGSSARKRRGEKGFLRHFIPADGRGARGSGGGRRGWVKSTCNNPC